MIYEIRTYNLIGAKLETYAETTHTETDIKELNRKFGRYNIRYATEIPKGAINGKEKFLPYVADVIEDLPVYCKFEPKTYKDCILLSETHGTYLQFYHEPTNEVLRIALNSNYYTNGKII